MRYDEQNAEAISHLHPAAQHMAWMAIDELEFVGEDCLISDTTRTVEEQENLWRQGRTRPGKIVTDARGGQSFHNYGLAFDVVPVGPLGVAMNKKNKLEWAAIGRYDTYGRILQGIGLSWGFQMWGFDRPHFQYTEIQYIDKLTGEWRTRNLTLKEVQAGHRPDEKIARMRRREVLADRLAIARRAVTKPFISPMRRRRLERYIDAAEARLRAI